MVNQDFLIIELELTRKGWIIAYKQNHYYIDITLKPREYKSAF